MKSKVEEFKEVDLKELNEVVKGGAANIIFSVNWGGFFNGSLFDGSFDEFDYLPDAQDGN